MQNLPNSWKLTKFVQGLAKITFAQIPNVHHINKTGILVSVIIKSSKLYPHSWVLVENSNYLQDLNSQNLCTTTHHIMISNKVIDIFLSFVRFTSTFAGQFSIWSSPSPSSLFWTSKLFCGFERMQRQLRLWDEYRDRMKVPGNLCYVR